MSHAPGPGAPPPAPARRPPPKAPLVAAVAVLLVTIAVQGAALRSTLAGVAETAPAPSEAGPTVAPSVSPSPPPVGLLEPVSSPPLAPPSSPTAPPLASVPLPRVTTRVAVPALGIDLPVIAQTPGYPPCRVALYLTSFKQPGQDGVTYLYAHAQTGMFLPLLKASQVNDGRRMLGMDVLVWTGDNLRLTYRIVEVRRHITSLSGARAWSGESVWLQTSEGRGIPQKLQVVSTLAAFRDVDPVEAHPVPKPRAC